MKRKINRVGTNTLTVSLPTKWVQKQNIHRGDEVDVTEESHHLIISSTPHAHTSRIATINFDEFNTHMANKHLHEFYRQGIEEIHINFTNPTIYYPKHKTEWSVDKYINTIVDRFIGMEIISQTKNKIILQSFITHEEPKKVNVVQNRIYFLLKEFLDEMLNAARNNYAKFRERASDYHDNITKFIYYYLRLLNVSDMPEAHKARLTALYIVIDKIVDKLRHVSEKISTMKHITTKTTHHLKKIFDYFIEQFMLVHKENIPLLDINNLVKKRYLIVNALEKETFTLEEYKTIAEARLLLDTLNDFNETYVALRMEKYIKK